MNNEINLINSPIDKIEYQEKVLPGSRYKIRVEARESTEQGKNLENFKCYDLGLTIFVAGTTFGASATTGHSFEAMDLNRLRLSTHDISPICSQILCNGFYFVRLGSTVIAPMFGIRMVSDKDSNCIKEDLDINTIAMDNGALNNFAIYCVTKNKQHIFKYSFKFKDDVPASSTFSYIINQKRSFVLASSTCVFSANNNMAIKNYVLDPATLSIQVDLDNSGKEYKLKVTDNEMHNQGTMAIEVAEGANPIASKEEFEKNYTNSKRGLCNFKPVVKQPAPVEIRHNSSSTCTLF